MVINISVSNILYLSQEAVGYTQSAFPNYGTVVGADTYFSSKLNTETWEYAEYDTKIRSLKHATRLIEALAFKGKRSTDGQILFFPRATIDNGRVPDEIVYACYEIAIALLNDVDPEVEARNLSVTGNGYGGMRTSYNREYTQEHLRNGIPSSLAWSILRPYLSDPKAFRLSRGV
jgi:hypothetical protein